MEMSFEKTPKSFKTIQFQDCDMFGHLNNGRFIDYLLNAREDHLVNFYDLDIFAMTREKGVAWFVGKHEIVYRKPANLREEVAITSEVINFLIFSRLLSNQLFVADFECFLKGLTIQP